MTKTDIQQLSVEERLQLIGDIWDSIVDSSEVVPLTEAQKRELDRRVALHRQNPDAGTPWEVVRDRLGKRK